MAYIIDDDEKLDDGRIQWPAAERNKGPLAEVLAEVLPETGVLLEIASGTGQHAAHIAARFPGLTWHPTEFDEALHASIDAWCRDLENVRSVVHLDTCADAWHLDRADAIFCANMIHIAPWEAALGLLAGAGRVLSEGGVLAIYGPFMRGGVHTAESNAAFDQRLKERNPAWGVRDLDEVERAAQPHGLVLERVVEMPANNLTVIFVRG